MKYKLAMCALLAAEPSMSAALTFEGQIQQPLKTFNIRQADIYRPVSVIATSADGKCTVNLEMARMDPDPDSADESLSGRVASAYCNGRSLESGFATGSFKRLGGDTGQINSKIDIVLVVDE